MALPDHWTITDIDRLVTRGEVADLIEIPIAITNLGTPDAQWSESICLALAEHEHPNVRANAVLGLGHLARVSRTLTRPRALAAISRALVDPDPGVRAHALSAVDDVRQFLGWSDLEPLPSHGYQDSDFEIFEAVGRRVEVFEAFLDEAGRPESLIVLLDGLGWHHCFLDAFLGFWRWQESSRIQDVRETYEEHHTEDLSDRFSLRGRVVRAIVCARVEARTRLEFRFDHGSLFLEEQNPADLDAPSLLRWQAAGQQGDGD
jgi:hypothetical protein